MSDKGISENQLMNGEDSQSVAALFHALRFSVHVPKREKITIISQIASGKSSLERAGAVFSKVTAKEYDGARREVCEAVERGVSVISILSDEYPPLLRCIDCPPPVLFVRGQLPKLPAIAVVGTRRPTRYGLRVAEQLAAVLAPYRVAVISGLAFGVDESIHRGLLRIAGRSALPVAVLGSGVLRVTPSRNCQLAEAILDSGGGIISEYGLEREAFKYTFPERNRVISGLSQAVIVVEAAKRSGSLITARLAAEQGREVFSVAGEINSIASAGTNMLIAEGATGVLSVEQFEEVVTALGAEKGSRKESKKSLGKHARVLLRLIGEDAGIDLDSLADKLSLPTSAIAHELLELELEELINVEPGNRYSLTSLGLSNCES